ncbi:MAG: hypothetical protein PHW56_02595 [Methanosarcinaceae archaeon]|nr:hypothetical protein [Methanosarcinaceae archaeon]
MINRKGPDYGIRGIFMLNQEILLHNLFNHLIYIIAKTNNKKISLREMQLFYENISKLNKNYKFITFTNYKNPGRTG